jgi:hypothetical protein
LIPAIIYRDIIYALYPSSTPPQTSAIFRDFKKSTAMCKVHNVGLRYIKYFLLGRLEQPRQTKNLMYQHDKPNDPTKEGHLSFVFFESPFTSVLTVSSGHPFNLSELYISQLSPKATEARKGIQDRSLLSFLISRVAGLCRLTILVFSVRSRVKITLTFHKMINAKKQILIIWGFRGDRPSP